MKTLKHLLILLVAVSATASNALAHDMHMAGSKEGFLGLKPEYLHVLLNPLPVYGLGIGIVTLAFGLLARNKSTRTAGLIITAICAASAWPVLYFGQHGYNNLAPMLAMFMSCASAVDAVADTVIKSISKFFKVFICCILFC